MLIRVVIALSVHVYPIRLLTFRFPRLLNYEKRLLSAADQNLDSRRQSIRAAHYGVYARCSISVRGDPNSPPWLRRRYWLEQQYNGAGPSRRDFRPQPYEQLARIMRQTGYSYDASQIACEKRRFRQRAGALSFGESCWDAFLRITCNYGYSIGRVSLWLAVVVLVGTATIELAHRQDLVRYADAPPDLAEPEPPFREFSSLTYALDRLIPVVDFGYASDWQIAHGAWACEHAVVYPDTRAPAWVAVVGSALDQIVYLVDSAVKGLQWILTQTGDPILHVSLPTTADCANPTALAAARAFQVAMAVYSIVGFLLFSIAVVTYSGLMRRD